MRWMLLVCAVGCSDFKETLYINVDDAQAVTIGDKTYTSTFEIDRDFSSEDDALDAKIPAVAHFADKDVPLWFGTTCGELPGPLLGGPSWVSSACSFYLVKDNISSDCACVDSDGDTVAWDSTDDQGGFGSF